jgi:polyisoprenyl-teichoic acid--peptidoglycan teichoic acid transferase
MTMSDIKQKILKPISVLKNLPIPVFLSGVLIISIVMGWLVYLGISNYLVNRYQKSLNIANAGIQSGESSNVGTQEAGGQSQITSSGISIDENALSLTPWDGANRVTILMLGLDYRDWEAGTDYSRSDTMILLTLDPFTKSAGILSVPRDLWVEIPGYEHGKINTAYYLGEAHKLPGGGPGLAVETVQQFLGVPINYYAQIDFSAFVKFIDELGGVKIDVPETITVDLLGSGAATKKKLKPGVQVLPGEWALAYARARYTSGGDFDRAARQQQVILAIRDRILSLDLLPQLISKAPTLYKELASGIHTNLPLDDALKLATLASQVSKENIHQGIIDEKMVQFGTSPDGLSILIPVPDQIHLLRNEIFASAGVFNPLTTGDTQAQMVAEGARISIINGSSQENLGERTSQYLTQMGVNVISVSNALQTAMVTKITDYSGKPLSLRYFIDLFHLTEARIKSEYNPGSSMDIEIILGDDWATNNSLP